MCVCMTLCFFASLCTIDMITCCIIVCYACLYSVVDNNENAWSDDDFGSKVTVETACVVVM